MKSIKQILNLLILLVFMNVHAETQSKVCDDSKNVISTVYKDVKKIAPKIEASINEIAKGMKVGAKNIWNILVRQQLVWSFCFLILTITSLINWYLFYCRMYPKIEEWTILEKDLIGEIVNPKYEQFYADDERFVKRHDIRTLPTVLGKVGAVQYNAPKYKEINDHQKVFHWLHFIICCTLSVFSFIHFSDMLTGFINPEFGAIKTIVTFSSQIIK